MAKRVPAKLATRGIVPLRRISWGLKPLRLGTSVQLIAALVTCPVQRQFRNSVILTSSLNPSLASSVTNSSVLPSLFDDSFIRLEQSAQFAINPHRARLGPAVRSIIILSPQAVGGATGRCLPAARMRKTSFASVTIISRIHRMTSALCAT
ncbi:MAG TPA: hypothetical protein DCS07_00170 [Bdellovibrionales bacterium]|nr:MAG: hypothetical protein A2Z97_06570 [Bdellovibrionales bacterium GWB1_52_6]OFZ05146.1 MAG: hypothetical protein A2X97_09335 [Bdellovibrionales bacterium GWA1_52_35]HAR41047.1 hypothetical protein [Bdellovibrionales bacterium]HCM38896.1 hypothetical protein [Bdellovibrionales bacterium]